MYCTSVIYEVFSDWKLLSRGELAQLARASALQAEGQGFEPPILHKKLKGSERRALRKRDL